MTKLVALDETVEEVRPKILASQVGLAAAIGRNTAFGAVAGVVQVATRFVTIPIVIAHLGLGGYGIWSIIMTAAAYMRFGSIGTGVGISEVCRGSYWQQRLQESKRPSSVPVAP